MTGTAPRSRITWTKASASYPLSAITYSVGAEGGSALACRELELERVAQSVDAHVNFAAEATPASAQGPRPLAPLLRGAPAAQGWARITVLSSRRCSMSGSLAKASCILFQTPCSHQRRKRLYTEFHRPYSGGSARHWAPVREIHKIPVRKRRQFSSCPTDTPEQVRKN